MRLLVKRDRFHEVGGVRDALADRLGMCYHYHATISLLAAALPHLVAGGWWLVAGCWRLVAGGWWLVARGWWLVARGCWLAAGGW